MAEKELMDSVSTDDGQELVEFKASGENSSIADPVATKSNKRLADKAASFTPPKGAPVKSGSEGNEDMISAKGSKTSARKADKAGSDAPASNKVATPGQGASFAEDIDAIFDGEDLSEDLREKAETIFEAALNAKIVQMDEEYAAAFQVQLAEATEALTEELSGKVDEYVNYIAEQWYDENKVAVESSLKVEVAESFMNGIRGLMEAHNINIPADADNDVLETLRSKVEELEGQIEEETAEKIAISNQLAEAVQKVIFSEVTQNLADSQIEKIRALSEGLDYVSAEQYSKKLVTLRESYFSIKAAPSSVEDAEPVELDEEVRATGPMANYAAAISRTARK
tara:strand:+ start:21313 stop:22332 length:1020 start_codon:yes stop_codon:yes gene_type:complete